MLRRIRRALRGARRASKRRCPGRARRARARQPTSARRKANRAARKKGPRFLACCRAWRRRRRSGTRAREQWAASARALHSRGRWPERPHRATAQPVTPVRPSADRALDPRRVLPPVEKGGATRCRRRADPAPARPRSRAARCSPHEPRCGREFRPRWHQPSHAAAATPRQVVPKRTSSRANCSPRE
jgi:hypothetical protein